MNVTELRFDGEVALVTGAGRGIGRGHALELARRGARVVVNDTDGPAAKTVAHEISAAGGQAVASHDSVATPVGGAAIVDQALDAFGQLDIVVSNAGILRDKSFGQLTPDLVDAVLDVHLAAMSKWWPPQVAKEAIETAWVTHGNLGYSAESPLQQRYRDVASYLVADGTAAIQKRIIATSLLGKVATE